MSISVDLAAECDGRLGGGQPCRSSGGQERVGGQPDVDAVEERAVPIPAPLLFDKGYPEAEQLPRRAVYTFTPTTLPDGRAIITLHCDGRQVGDPLTDASRISDDYRLHDVFHIACAYVLASTQIAHAPQAQKRPARGRGGGRRPSHRTSRRASRRSCSILVGFTAWRQLHAARGNGTLTIHMLARKLEVERADLYG